MDKCKKIELLSPAGNVEGFYGAIHAGADAVYLAGERFGARAYAENFTTESLVECIRYGHLLGRKIYLTVNTLLKETEISCLYDYIQPFYEAGLDAVIVQDLGVIRLIRESFPGLKLHVSTQMTLCGSYGAALLKDMGAERVVPARELSLQELISMRREADIETEAFIHGAMCYCYSGQCLFSSILGGRSGNRGRCAQPCRLPYRVGTRGRWGAECYPLSLKDMCTIRHIPGLIEAGIDSFKIEGRMKKPEYTAGVTAIYRHYIDRYLDLREQRGPEAAAEAYHVEKADQERLKSLYIRSGIQDGYYFRRNGREMVTLESPAYTGTSDKVLAEIREKYIVEKERLPVRVKAVFRVGHPAEVTYSWQDRDSTVAGDVVERAGKQPVTQENIRRQLGRLGESAFRVSGMEIEADEDCFYSLKRMNEMRRAAVSGLEEQILSDRSYDRQGRALPEESGGQAACRDRALPEESGRQAICRDEIRPKESGGQAAVRDRVLPEECEGRVACRDEVLPEECEGRVTCRDEILPEECGGQVAYQDKVLPEECEGQMPCRDEILPKEREEQRTGYAVSVTTLPQLEAAARWFSAEKAQRPLRFYIEGDLFLQEGERVQSLCRQLPGESRFYLTLPYILRESDKPYLERLTAVMGESGIFRGFLVRSMDGLGFVRDLRSRPAYQGKKPACRTDAGIYTWNRQAVRELFSLRDAGPAALRTSAAEDFLVEGFCLPYELRAKEQSGLPEGLSCEKIVYGRIPMMITANCLLRTMGQCGGRDGEVTSAWQKDAGAAGGRGQESGGECRGGAYGERSCGAGGIRRSMTQISRHAVLQDRYRNEFPVTANCLHCVNIIYNTVPLSLHQTRWKGHADLRLDFTMESPEEVTAVLDTFLKGAPFPQKGYTTGHEKRGVE